MKPITFDELRTRVKDYAHKGTQKLTYSPSCFGVDGEDEEINTPELTLYGHDFSGEYPSIISRIYGEDAVTVNALLAADCSYVITNK